MKQKEITPVKNTREKYETYRVQIGRYRKAVAGKFYLEALLIDYALLEDRLYSWLYHMGVIIERSKMERSSVAGRDIKGIVSQYKKEEEKASLDINSISGKMKIIRCVLLWSTDIYEKDIETNKYLRALKRQCESIDIHGMLDALEDIEKWKNYRNEVIHGLMNKNYLSLDREISTKVEDGKKLVEYLDNHLKIFKKGEKVRKAANLSDIL